MRRMKVAARAERYVEQGRAHNWSRERVLAQMVADCSRRSISMYTQIDLTEYIVAHWHADLTAIKPEEKTP